VIRASKPFVSWTRSGPPKRIPPAEVSVEAAAAPVVEVAEAVAALVVEMAAPLVEVEEAAEVPVVEAAAAAAVPGKP
jgi:hypothetical protein